MQGRAIDPTSLTRTFTTLLRKAGLRRIRFRGLRHSTATLLLEQGVELVVIKELLGHAHIGVTATVYAHVRLRLQRDAIDTLGRALDHPGPHTATAANTPGVRRRCRQLLPSARRNPVKADTYSVPEFAKSNPLSERMPSNACVAQFDEELTIDFSVNY
ncbi:hypothetical protein RKD27_005594 [Streptomyces sp. SAI-126]|uniref:tyrosine-type recombinase/integrase n=1 Tax=Streptomyces sp. SAI-126 TaxID=3377732 RepID=UPI003C7C6E4C